MLNSLDFEDLVLNKNSDCGKFHFGILTKKGKLHTYRNGVVVLVLVLVLVVVVVVVVVVGVVV